MTTTFHKFTVAVLAVLMLAISPLTVFAQNEDEDDILIEPPLTWSVNSIQIVWSVTKGATTEQATKYLYGADQTNAESFGIDKTTEEGTTIGGTVAGGARVDAMAKLESNPFTFFGLLGAKVNGSAYLEGGFNYNQTNRATTSNQWSESEKNVVNKVLTESSETVTQQTISHQRLVFTVDFVNHTSTRLFFDPQSANTIPVYCGQTHLGDARLISKTETEIVSIAATGKPIPCQFELELNDTGKQSLVNNRPTIRIDGGQLLIKSMPNAREQVADAIQESTVATKYFTVAILSGDRVMEWKVRWFKKNPVTLLEALEAINENIRDTSNDDNKTLFAIEDNHFQTVCNAPFTDKDAPDWTAELKVFKGTDVQTVDNPDAHLADTPRRGERYVFQLTSQEIKKLTKKAEDGDAEAQCELSNKYYYGENVQEDKIEAVKWCRKAAEQGVAKAQYNLGCSYKCGVGISVDKEEAVKWWTKAAEQGFTEAQCSLGTCYYNGDGVSVDKEEAVKWYRKAAEQGHAKAQYCLGYSYMYGDGISIDKEEAVKWWTKSAEQGNAWVQYSLGLYYYKGDGVTKNKEEAVKWFRKAAEQGLADAQLLIGLCYYVGDGVSKDITGSVRWYRKAAEQGHAKAQFLLGYRYENGKGVTEDKMEAVKWYHKAAEQGHTEAQFRIGLCYYQGNGVTINQAEAVKWWTKAAEQGYADAQYNLGMCYENGIGIAIDNAEAVKWYRKAAEQGEIGAQFNLGGCYMRGEGVTIDKAEAVKWWTKAAEQGYAKAQYCLGISYLNGDGVSINKVAALKWISKAAEQGLEEAKDFLRKNTL